MTVGSNMMCLLLILIILLKHRMDLHFHAQYKRFTMLRLRIVEKDKLESLRCVEMGRMKTILIAFQAY